MFQVNQKKLAFIVFISLIALSLIIIAFRKKNFIDLLEIMNKNNANLAMKNSPFNQVIEENLKTFSVTSSAKNSSKKTVLPTSIENIGDNIYRAQFKESSNLASPQEILNEVNNYRNRQGKADLIWHDGLASWAYNRAVYFTEISNVDSHIGYKDQANTKGNEMGFGVTGEVSAFGLKIDAYTLINDAFSQDDPHRSIILDSEFTYIGIGVATKNNFDYGYNLILGGNSF